MSGSSGADLSLTVIVILGLASLFADAISMYVYNNKSFKFFNRAVSDYMSQMAEKDMYKSREERLKKDFEANDDFLEADLKILLKTRNPNGSLNF